MVTLYTSVVLLTIMLLITTAADVLTNRLVAKEMKHWTVVACVMIGLASLGECIGVLTNGAAPVLVTMHKLAKLVEFCAAPMIAVSAAIAYGSPKHPRLLLTIVEGHAVFECVALWFGWVFRVDEANFYHREGLYGVYVAVFVLSILACVISVIRSGKENQTGLDAVLLLTVLIAVIGIAIQFVYSTIRIDFLCIAISNHLLYSRCYKIVLQLDAVTRLLNRRCFDAALGTLSGRAAVIFFDINRFKQINDSYGHAVGDLCLRKVGDRVRQVYGRNGTCYRIGGDEFCVLLESELDQLEAMNKQFHQSIQAMQAEDSRMPDVALGYAFYHAESEHIQKAIEEADAMMYRNKAVFAEE